MYYQLYFYFRLSFEITFRIFLCRTKQAKKYVIVIFRSKEEIQSQLEKQVKNLLNRTLARIFYSYFTFCIKLTCAKMLPAAL